MSERMAFSPAEAAEALGLSERKIRDLVARGELRARRIGTRVLIPREELQRLLRDDAVTAATT